MSKERAERDYILGTHDEEIERLGLQHRVWRQYATAAWARAGFTVGQTLLDVGCGPGYAALDLAEIVGPTGRVVALDRSRRFLDTLEERAHARGVTNIDVHEIDLGVDALPQVQADGAWCRWVYAFVPNPKALLSRVAGALRPGAPLVVHEYFDYSMWRSTPSSPEHEEFVELVIRSWRETGGEPDVGLEMLPWLAESGLAIKSLLPIVEVITPADYMWQWPKAFVNVGLDRLVELGLVTRGRADEIGAAFERGERAPGVHMITPGVLEIVAVKD